MTIRWIEGFELNVPEGANSLKEKYQEAPFFGGYVAEGHYFGNSSRGAQLRTPSFGLENTFTVGVDIYLATQPSEVVDHELRFLRYDLEQCRVELADSGPGWTVAVKRGATTLATASSEEFELNAWHYLEVQVTPSTSGSYSVRVNGETILSGSSANLAATGFTKADVVEFNLNGRVDHIYITDDTGARNTSFLGPQVIEGLEPDEDGTTTDWDKSTSTLDHHEILNWQNNPDMDYVSADTPGTEELLGVQDIKFIEAEIKCIALLAGLFQSGIGTRTLKGLFKQKGEDVSTLTEKTLLGNAAKYILGVEEQNTREDRGWQKRDINEGQFGEELES